MSDFTTYITPLGKRLSFKEGLVNALKFVELSDSSINYQVETNGMPVVPPAGLAVVLPQTILNCGKAGYKGMYHDLTPDNGIGISPADQAVIFEKFRQVSDTPSGKPRGSGLGLAISREIIHHFGGRLWVESTPSRGSKFSFTLPLPRSNMAFLAA